MSDYDIERSVRTISDFMLPFLITIVCLQTYFETGHHIFVVIGLSMWVWMVIFGIMKRKPMEAGKGEKKKDGKTMSEEKTGRTDEEVIKWAEI